MSILNKFFGKGDKKAKGAQNFVALQGLNPPRWSKRDYARFAKEGYQNNVIVHRCISEIARSIGEVPFILEEHGQRLDRHPLLTLLNKPNDEQNRASFLQSVVSYLLISGNAFIEASSVSEKGTLTALYALRPDGVRIDCEDGVKRYFYGAQKGEIELSSASVLHIKTFNPLDEIYGLSPIEAAAFSIDQHNAAGAHNQALLQNGARPLGALVYKSPGGAMLSEDQRHDLRNQIEDHHSGALNAGRVMVLEGEFDWKEMGIRPRDMDFMDMKHSAARDIAQAFGVPPVLVGLPGDATYSNMAEARLALWEQTIIPLMNQIVSSLEGFLGPKFGEGLKLSFDLDAISAITQKRQALWEKLEQASFLTTNEKREAVGYGPLEEGNASKEK